MITNSIERNDSNLLSGLTPTFSGWNTNPGTAANIVDELTTDLTTDGVQTNAVNSTITYDLGISKRVIVNLFRSSVATGAGVVISLSDDDATYYVAGRSTSNPTISGSVFASGKCRYIRLVFYSAAVGNTITAISARAYEI